MSANTFPVLFNDCYGGFGYSSKAVHEYNKRLPAGSTKINENVKNGPFARLLVNEIKKDIGSVDEKFVWDIDRADSLMVEICSELGDEANGQNTKLAIKDVPIKFRKHYYIEEYDGLEEVHIDFQQYKLDTIQSIVKDDTISSDAKVKIVQDTLLEEYEEDD
jgi:hypothetical protein